MTYSQQSSDVITVLFDGGCPLCQREINHYRSLKGAEKVNWIDITQSENQLSQYGINLKEAMLRFHVMDAEGVWHTGAMGFVVLWKQLPAFKWLAFALEKMRLISFAEWIYGFFAQRRFQNRCNSQACNLD